MRIGRWILPTSHLLGSAKCGARLAMATCASSRAKAVTPKDNDGRTWRRQLTPKRLLDLVSDIRVTSPNPCKAHARTWRASQADSINTEGSQPQEVHTLLHLNSSLLLCSLHILILSPEGLAGQPRPGLSRAFTVQVRARRLGIPWTTRGGIQMKDHGPHKK